MDESGHAFLPTFEANTAFYKAGADDLEIWWTANVYCSYIWATATIKDILLALVRVVGCIAKPFEYMGKAVAIGIIDKESFRESAYGDIAEWGNDMLDHFFSLFETKQRIFRCIYSDCYL